MTKNELMALLAAGLLLMLSNFLSFQSGQYDTLTAIRVDRLEFGAAGSRYYGTCFIEGPKQYCATLQGN